MKIDKSSFFMFLFISCYIGVILGGIIATMYPMWLTCPSAMDVYQGKTTLEYTVIDNVAIDSVVIWKKTE